MTILNTEPIPVSEALRLCEMAIEDCDKATPGPWTVLGSYVAANRPFLGLARAVMRPLIEYHLELIRSNEESADGIFGCMDHSYHPTHSQYTILVALRSHYDRVRPDWRKS